MFDDEDQAACYAEWAQDELVFGKGWFNWGKDFTHPPIPELQLTSEEIEKYSKYGF